MYLSRLLDAECLRGAGIDTGSALGTLFGVHNGDLVVVHGDGFFGALIDTGSATYTFIFVNYSWHYYLLQIRQGWQTLDREIRYITFVKQLTRVLEIVLKKKTRFRLLPKSFLTLPPRFRPVPSIVSDPSALVFCLRSTR